MRRDGTGRERRVAVSRLPAAIPATARTRATSTRCRLASRRLSSRPLIEELQADIRLRLASSSKAPHSRSEGPRRRGAGRPGLKGGSRRSSARSGDSGESDSDEPSPGRACLRCGRDVSHRRSDAKTCGTTCRKQVERHGPLAVAEPLRAVLYRCNGHHIVDEFGDGCAKCGHFLPTLEVAA